MKTKNAA